jgi:UPF0176 protein
MIDDAGKQRLTLSFYAYAQSRSNSISKRFIPRLGSLVVLGRIYVAKEVSMRNYHSCR